jgi:hypothetical protein
MTSTAGEAESVKTRMSTLEFTANGLPTAPAVERLYDELDSWGLIQQRNGQ